MKRRDKSARKAWWRSLTLTQQTDYIYKKMEEKGKSPNWNHIYYETKKLGYYKK